jgi:hypothetical protein
MQLKGVVLALFTLPAFADTRVVLVGGGNELQSSQAQIEANVRWLEDLLLARGLDVATYFGIGAEPGMDVVYRPGAAGADAGGADAWVRVFGDDALIGARFKRHELQAVRGSTRKSELTSALRRELGALGSGDELLLVYNGHGGLVAENTRNNYLKLWGNDRLSVGELEGLLDTAPAGTTQRFVMTQCYSGAFGALVYDDPHAAEGFMPNRCGFMAESALRQAEGCELDADPTEFRDYTTYFFAALSGVSRLGEPLPLAEIDRDGDGAVSYREAHFHALLAAESTDLPRSTSEQFLEDWSPWYLRWSSTVDNPGSVYWTLGSELAARYGWPYTADALDRAHADYAAAASASFRRYHEERARIAALRAELAADYAGRWPGLTDGPSIEKTAPGEAMAALRADSRYAELVALQDGLASYGRASLAHERAVTQLEKIYRLRQLARLEGALQRLGSPAARGQYGHLLACEAGTLDTAQ